jgi:iron complex outermembrane receptor protein
VKLGSERKNVLDTNIYGLELEYTGDISLIDKFYVNYSYTAGTSKLKDTGVETDLTNVAHHLAKGYYIYTINNALALSTIAKYVGAKERVSSDTREKVPAYATLDATLNYKNRKYDFEITLSAKNIFDAKVIYPSPPNTYVEDYAQEGRNFLVTLKKEF